MDMVVIPDVLDLVERKALPREIYAPDGTLLFKPYDPAVESPLLMNRKTWRLFANYIPVESRPEEERWLARVNTTGQLVEIRDKSVANMLYYVRTRHPGATPEEVVGHELEEVVKDAGEFENDDEMIAYAMYLYIALALAISHGLLVLA